MLSCQQLHCDIFLDGRHDAVSVGANVLACILGLVGNAIAVKLT